MRRRLASYTFVLGLACMLGACGFQLRGTSDTDAGVPEAWKSMHLVTANPNGEFSRDVQTRFAANGVQWQDRQDANFRLVLSPERFSQRNLSLNAEARAAEFELTMRAQFSVLDADNNEVIASTQVSTIRQMENDPRNVMGKSEEIRLLKSEMRAELAQQIMRRIGFFATSTR